MQEKHNPIYKYLEAEKFIKYCSANNIDASLYALEMYEKAGLLTPIYRLIVPEEYVRETSKVKEPANKVYSKIKQKWSRLINLLNALMEYTLRGSPYFRKTLKNGHPLDYAYKNKNPFLYKPSAKEFKPWERYKIIVTTEKGEHIKKDTVEHFYASWQIFVLDELNYFHTVEENYVTGHKKGWGILKKNIFSSKLIKYYELFQTVSNFRMMESLIWLDLTLGVKEPVIEGELLNELNKKREKIAKKEYQKYSHDEWIIFIRKLVEVYNEYLKREKIKLSMELKRFLADTVRMIMYATQKSLQEISDDYDGKYKGSKWIGLYERIKIYPGEIKRIFPDELEEVRKRASKVLEGYIRQLNKILPDSQQISLDIKDKLINSIIESGHELLLSHIYKIEEFWFNRKLHWVSSIWAHLRALTVSIESIGTEWYNTHFLSNILKSAFPEYKSLKESIDKNITDAKSFKEYKEKLSKIYEHKKKHNNKGLCGHHLVVAHLTRNYFSHRIIFEPVMLGSKFLEVYRDLIFTLISLFIPKIK